MNPPQQRKGGGPLRTKKEPLATASDRVNLLGKTAVQVVRCMQSSKDSRFAMADEDSSIQAIKSEGGDQKHAAVTTNKAKLACCHPQWEAREPTDALADDKHKASGARPKACPTARLLLGFRPGLGDLCCLPPVP